MVTPQQLETALNTLLLPEYFTDYAPNGLQVASSRPIKKLVTGVSASLALIEAAIEQQADALLVHHGYFWKGENPCLVCMKYRRIKALMSHDISLLGYHLPLDAHSKFGNNAQLAHKLSIMIDGGLEPDNPHSIGNVGHLSEAISAPVFARHIEAMLGRKPQHLDGGERLIKKVAWCTGGAQGYFEKAVALGVDAFISGEVSEPTMHIARESGVHYFAAGHHATERYGVQAVGDWLADKFQLDHEFIDIPNPV